MDQSRCRSAQGPLPGYSRGRVDLHLCSSGFQSGAHEKYEGVLGLPRAAQILQVNYDVFYSQLTEHALFPLNNSWDKS
jgi:hypothetical protein